MRKPIPYKKPENNNQKSTLNIDAKKIIIVALAAIIAISLCIAFTMIFSIVFKISAYISAVVSAIFLVVLSAFIVRQFLNK